MKLIKYSLFLSAILLLFTACSGDGAKDSGNNGETAGGELKVAISSEPPTLDTHLATTNVASHISRHIFETLLTLDTEGGVHPMLAESYEVSEEGDVIDFILRQGVHFHNGQELKASDVVASMNRWMQVSSSGKETFPGAEFIEIDEYTVQLKMQNPTSTASLVLAYAGGEAPIIMPASMIEGKETERVTEYIGTGPFQFKEWKQDQHIHLTKFEDYSAREEPADGLAGKREALVDDLLITFVPDASTRVAGILTGEYDIIAEIPIDNVDQINNMPELSLYSTPKEMMNIFFNKKQGLFSNKLARQAVEVGINKEDALKASFVDPKYYKKTHHMMMAHQESLWYSDIGKDEYDQVDEELAKKLFKEAGYNGEEIILMTSRDYVYRYNAAIVVQEQLSNLGLNVKLEVYDWPTFTERRDDPNSYDISVMSSTAKIEPTSLTFLRKDFTGWTDSEELDEILERIRLAPSIEEAQGMYDDLQAWFMDYKPVVKLGDGDVLFAAGESVSDLVDVDGIIFWNVSNSK